MGMIWMKSAVEMSPLKSNNIVQKQTVFLKIVVLLEKFKGMGGGSQNHLIE